MWALIEEGTITRVIKHGLNVKVPKCAEPIGNLDLLTVEDRKSLGVYKVVEPEPVDSRYYAATYIKNTIDHFNGQVIQTNEISPQPIERVRKFRLEELKEILDKDLKSHVITTVVLNEQLCNGHKEIPYSIEIDVTDGLVSRLSMLAASDLRNNPIIFIESVDGEMHRFHGGHLETVFLRVLAARENMYKAYAETRHIINAWDEEDTDALIELDLEEKYQERLNDTGYIQG